MSDFKNLKNFWHGRDNWVPTAISCLIDSFAHNLDQNINMSPSHCKEHIVKIITDYNIIRSESNDQSKRIDAKMGFKIVCRVIHSSNAGFYWPQDQTVRRRNKRNRKYLFPWLKEKVIS